MITCKLRPSIASASKTESVHSSFKKAKNSRTKFSTNRPKSIKAQGYV